MKLYSVILSFIFFQPAFGNADVPPVVTAASVNLEKYVGEWYEIAAIPQSYQKQCVGNTKAQYSIAEESLISVVNTCDTRNGQVSTANGRARVVDRQTNSKLEVTFVNLFGWQFIFGGAYWILQVDENYSYAVVGGPRRDMAWILSRTASLPQEQLVQAHKVLIDQGYDTCKLISTLQEGGLQQATPLCLLVGDL